MTIITLMLAHGAQLLPLAGSMLVATFLLMWGIVLYVATKRFRKLGLGLCCSSVLIVILTFVFYGQVLRFLEFS